MRQSLLSLVAVLGAVLMHSPARAAGVIGLEAAFGNTIVSTYRDGREAMLWLEPDGRYRGEGPSGDASSGRWNASRGRLCLKQARPIPVPLAYCTPIPNVGVGGSWRAKSVLGEPLAVRLAAGRCTRC